MQAFASRAVRGFVVEDTVAINLIFANGALGSFLLSDTAACARNWEHTSQENKAYPTYDDEDCYVVTGTDGSLSIPTDPLKLQMEHFGAVVRGEAEPIVSARDGLENLRVTEANGEAARTGKVIAVAVA